MLSFSTYTDSQFRGGTLTSSFFSHPISSRRFEPQRINIGNNRCYHLKCGLVRAKGSLSRNLATKIKEPHKYFEQVIITVYSRDRGHGAILSMPNQRGPSKSQGKHDDELRKKSLYERDCDGSLIFPMVGHGGDVVIYVDEGKYSLMEFHKKSRYNAKRGGNVDAIGVLSSLLRDGLAALALRIPVPPGTVVKRKQQKLLADLHPGDEVLIVKSGQGGISFLEILEHGEKQLMALTTNVMRDENDKGLPNAGKSSLLAAITIAKPDIVSYPFTTLIPNLEHPDADPNLGSRRYAYEEATLANLPGVIESADLGPCGKDLAHNFWRHLRRTRLSVHVCHASAEDPVNDFRTVKEAKEMSSVDAVESSSEIPKDKKIGSSAQNSTKIKKSTPKSGLRRNRNRRIGSRKTVQRRIPKGVIHVQASFNNTIVTVTDIRGQVVSWSSAGTSGFKGTRRGTPFAAQTAAQNALRMVVSQGMQRAEVLMKGPGLGRDAALRAIRRSGIQLSFVRDVTPLPHNGCRPPKKRRV